MTHPWIDQAQHLNSLSFIPLCIIVGSVIVQTVLYSDSVFMDAVRDGVRCTAQPDAYALFTTMYGGVVNCALPILINVVCC